jgi:hypothetical protein
MMGVGCKGSASETYVVQVLNSREVTREDELPLVLGRRASLVLARRGSLQLQDCLNESVSIGSQLGRAREQLLQLGLVLLVNGGNQKKEQTQTVLLVDLSIREHILHGIGKVADLKLATILVSASGDVLLNSTELLEVGAVELIHGFLGEGDVQGELGVELLILGDRANEV